MLLDKYIGNNFMCQKDWEVRCEQKCTNVSFSMM